MLLIYEIRQFLSIILNKGIFVVMVVYVICDKDFIERRILITKRFEELGLTVRFIDAQIGSTLKPEEIRPFIASKRQNFHPNRFAINSIGCSLSHFDAWKQIIESEDGYGIVFEDDACPIKKNRSKIKPTFEKLVENKDKLDVVFFHSRKSKSKRVKIEGLIPGVDLASAVYSDFGAESYFITRNAAQYFFSSNLRHVLDVDFLMHRWWRHNRNVMYTVPCLFEEDGRVSTIDHGAHLGWDNDSSMFKVARWFNRANDSIMKRLLMQAQIIKMKNAVVGRLK